MGFISTDKLQGMGFKHVGKNVLISDKASIYGVSNISISDNVRIDDFCVISSGKGGIKIGRNVHIAVYCSIIGDAEVVMGDFSGLSSRVSVYSSSDDYSGNYLTNPTVPSEFTNVNSSPVFIGKHVIVGAGCVILPGVRIEEGSSIGAMSLVHRSVPEWSIFSGIPAKFLKERSKNLIEKECLYLKK